MSCPNWPSIVAERERLGEDTAGWVQALRHLDECPECWERALAADPALLFQRLPVAEVSEEDIGAMQQAVASMRRTRSIEQPRVRGLAAWKPSHAWSVAATLALLLAGTWLMRDSWISPPGSGEQMAGLDGGRQEVGFPETGRPESAQGEAVVHLKGPRPEPTVRLDLGPSMPSTAAAAVPTPGPEASVADLAEGDLEIEIQLLKAAAGGVSSDRIPPEVEERLRGIFNFPGYELLAGASLRAREGSEVLRDLGDGYRVRFELGKILGEGALKLSGFQVVRQVGNLTAKGRQAEPEELIETTLPLSLGQPLILGLAQNADEQDALMVAITCRRVGEAGGERP